MKVPTHETLHANLLMRQMGKAVFIRKNAGWNFASSFWAGIHNHLAHEAPKKMHFRMTYPRRQTRGQGLSCRSYCNKITNVRKVGS